MVLLFLTKCPKVRASPLLLQHPWNTGDAPERKHVCESCPVGICEDVRLWRRSQS